MAALHPSEANAKRAPNSSDLAALRDVASIRHEALLAGDPHCQPNPNPNPNPDPDPDPNPNPDTNRDPSPNTNPDPNLAKVICRESDLKILGATVVAPGAGERGGVERGIKREGVENGIERGIDSIAEPSSVRVV